MLDIEFAKDVLLTEKQTKRNFAFIAAVADAISREQRRREAKYLSGRYFDVLTEYKTFSEREVPHVDPGWDRGGEHDYEGMLEVIERDIKKRAADDEHWDREIEKLKEKK